MSTGTKYEQLSFERKRLQANNEAPQWYSTASYQLVTNKSYTLPGETPRGMYIRIANRAAELTTLKLPSDIGYASWNEAFFDIIWKGWFSPSTPVLSNMGNDRGSPVSCSGSFPVDSISSFYSTRTEMARLTQRGYGCSTCLDPIRPRGADISKGGKATGVMQFANGVVQDMSDISQGSRRGSAGIYINPLHPDFDEVADKLLNEDDGFNIGWNITDEFDDLFNRDPDRANHIWNRMMKVKMTKGKGYFFFLDKANRHMPDHLKQAIADKPSLKIRHSNLCSEISLPSDENHSFSCVLSSLNVSKYDEWKDTKLFEIAIVFLDAIIEDMLIKSKQEMSTDNAFERIIRFTENFRALGLGVLGLSTYYQQKSMVFGDFQSIQFNQSFFKEMKERTYSMSRYMAAELGEPLYLKGTGYRHATTMALPPTKSTAVIQSGISEGIQPSYAQVFSQDTAGGMVYRINPPLLKLMKERGKYNDDEMRSIANNNGSVSDCDWLSEHEKAVFRTAFEINQNTILLMGSHRGKHVDQGQSINLYFDNDTTEAEVSELHDKAFKDENILGLYYIHSLNASGIQKASECEACEG